MPEVRPRKLLTYIDETYHEGGPRSHDPPRRGWIVAVVENPFFGRYVPEIQYWMEDLKPLGLRMADHLISALGGAQAIEGYGKGAIVGLGGEIEHAALWHAPGGYAMRERLGGAKAIVPSTKKVGGPGTRLDVPITHIDAAYVRSHFDSVEAGLDDGPRNDEIALVLAMTTGPRVHSRSGGLEAWQIAGEDGLR